MPLYACTSSLKAVTPRLHHGLVAVAVSCLVVETKNETRIRQQDALLARLQALCLDRVLSPNAVTVAVPSLPRAHRNANPPSPAPTTPPFYTQNEPPPLDPALSSDAYFPSQCPLLLPFEPPARRSRSCPSPRVSEGSAQQPPYAPPPPTPTRGYERPAWQCVLDPDAALRSLRSPGSPRKPSSRRSFEMAVGAEENVMTESRVSRHILVDTSDDPPHTPEHSTTYQVHKWPSESQSPSLPPVLRVPVISSSPSAHDEQQYDLFSICFRWT
uniref:Uncharacterized protein n=1 Tax=Chromera velia CCMP2878 TaxID=1169474 RepID=A0A0G4FDV1_9ALVE|eukprot:Cvel_16442.t1-p1 / transcript=Cvel_16442.t1 / gene=Cvel_16442 / organism=Chromera_velia_CCMP2878 / gene_product=hypothetical protein / transcript_product=hypothetical protein / location=Cvel_scaffold1267:28107-29159(+) / protein_length=270 / sequence_SO=supercontig / SO=protein_coding / is_pseudo=false